MKIQIWKTLARTVLLESARRKDIWVIVILGFLMICSASLLGVFGFQGLQSFVKDLTVNVLGLLSTIVAVVTACRVLPEEEKNRTLYPLLARPISRFDLIMGKWLGAVLVSWVAFLSLSVVSCFGLLIFHVPLELLMLQYVIAKLMGLALICAVGLCLSVYMTPAAATTLAFVLSFGTTMITRAMTMAASTSPGGNKTGYQLITAALPQFSLFDFGSRVANTGWGLVPLWVFGVLAGYLAIYSSAMLYLSWAKFRRKAI